MLKHYHRIDTPKHRAKDMGAYYHYDNNNH